MILNLPSSPDSSNGQSFPEAAVPAEENPLRRLAADRSWCGPEFIIMLLGGKWSTRILYLLIHSEPRRFTGLLNDLDGISNKELASQLKYMTARKLIVREDSSYKKYSVTPLGRSLHQIFDMMDEWSVEFLNSMESP